MQKLSPELIRARTCYKHPAGALGVAITRALQRRGCIAEASVQQRHGFMLTGRGRKWCARHGIDAYLPVAFFRDGDGGGDGGGGGDGDGGGGGDGGDDGGGAGGRASTAAKNAGFSASCMDYSQRVPHLAGPLGRGVLAFMQARGYCLAGAGDRRLALTPDGVAFLRAALGIDEAGRAAT